MWGRGRGKGGGMIREKWDGGRGGTKKCNEVVTCKPVPSLYPCLAFSSPSRQLDMCEVFVQWEQRK